MLHICTEFRHTISRPTETVIKKKNDKTELINEFIEYLNKIEKGFT